MQDHLKDDQSMLQIIRQGLVKMMLLFLLLSTFSLMLYENTIPKRFSYFHTVGFVKAESYENAVAVFVLMICLSVLPIVFF